MSHDAAEAGAAPTSVGTFTFDRFVVRKARFEEVEQAPGEPGEKRPALLTSHLKLNVQLEQDTEKARARVVLSVIVQPDLKWQPYEIEVVVVGLFREASGDHGLLEQFCMANAPAILFPYARQIIHTLTADAGYGPVRLNPVNLQAITAAPTSPEL